MANPHQIELPSTHMAYDTEVNKGNINMGHLANHLNRRNADGGWRLVHIFEQHGNTMMIYEQDARLDHLIAAQQETNRLLRQLLGADPATAPQPPSRPDHGEPPLPSAWQPPPDKKRPWQRG